MKKLKMAAGAVLGSFLLAGCGQLGPGVAAEIGGTKIDTSDVELLTQAQCADAKAAGQTQPIATLHAQSLNALLDAELQRPVRRRRGRRSYDPELAARRDEVATRTR